MHINSLDAIYAKSILDSNFEDQNRGKTLNESVADGSIIGYSRARMSGEQTVMESCGVFHGSFLVSPLMAICRYITRIS